MIIYYNWNYILIDYKLFIKILQTQLTWAWSKINILML